MEIGAGKPRPDRELLYKPLTLSDINVVKLLLKHGDTFNKYYGHKTNNNIYEAGEIEDTNQELINLYAALDKLVDECEFNDKQLQVLNLVRDGYDLLDIGRLSALGLSRQLASWHFNNVCQLIVDKNNEQWEKWINTYYKNRRVV